MRATTFSTPNVSRATRAARMFELSPLLTGGERVRVLDAGGDERVAVEADAGDRLARRSEVPSRRNADGVWSMTATEWPLRPEGAGERRPDAAASHDHEVHRRDATPSARPERASGRAPVATARRGPAADGLSGERSAYSVVVPVSDRRSSACSSDARSAATSSGDTLLPKRIALPIFASDALSSVAYAPDEILLMLALAGGALRR